MKYNIFNGFPPLITVLLAISINVHAEDDFSKKRANPIASLISVPIQANYDENFGRNDDGSIWKINVQPVIPVSISDNWNMISRTIAPIIDQTDVPIAGEGKTGVGDILQSLFFSPKAPTSNGLVWGVGPAILFNSASKDELAGASGIGLMRPMVQLKTGAFA